MKNQSQQAVTEQTSRTTGIVDPMFIERLVALKRSNQRSCYVQNQDGTVTFIKAKNEPFDIIG